MTARAFSQLTDDVDDLVDEHLGDIMWLVYKGHKQRIQGTVRTEEYEQFVDGAMSVGFRFYASLTERKMPFALSGSSGAQIIRKDPYNALREEVYDIVAVDQPRSGRIKCVLSENKGADPSTVEDRRASTNTNQTPYR